MFVRRVVFLLALLFTFAVAEAAPPQPADVVFRSGGVYTVDAARSWAESVAVREGRIVYVGSDSGLTPWIGPRTRQIDLKGKMLLPGFHDSHVHLVGGGIELGECDLNGLATLEQVLKAVREFAKKHPEKKWIRGGGLSNTSSGPRSSSGGEFAGVAAKLRQYPGGRFSGERSSFRPAAQFASFQRSNSRSERQLGCP